MTGWLLGVGAGIAVAVAVGLIAWLVTPIRHRLERSPMVTRSDHGIALAASWTPSELNSIRRENMLGLDPRWLLGSVFYFPSDAPPPEPPPVADAEGWWQWAARHGGTDVAYSHVLIRLQATQDRAILVERPRLVQHVRPIRGGVICGPEGLGGNGLLARRFFVDLDAEIPDVKYFDASNDERETAQFSLRRGDSEAFLVIVQATTGRHEWHLELPCLVDGVRVTMKIDRDGEPFSTVGPSGIKTFMLPHDQADWVPVD